ncbi:MAG: HNH endonuclease signature motif containing protein [Pseudomonadota bacterium]
MSQSFRSPETPLFRALWDRQSGICGLCGKPMPRSRANVAHARLWKKHRPSYDHIVPRSKGGRDAPENLQLAHYACNLRKGSELSPRGGSKRRAPQR